jgi:DNA-binding transcriptional MocR family regulator
MKVNQIIDMVSLLKDSLRSGVGIKYKLLATAMASRIQAGEIEAGTKLPPHRILADAIGVNIGTVARVYGELEHLGLVVARVGDGTFVRKVGLESKRETGFRNALDQPEPYYDMSRNLHIPGQESTYLTQTLMELANNPEILRELMLYTPDMGLMRHRQAGAHWLTQSDFKPSPEQVLCVNGAQHGLMCALIALLRSGDALVTEQLTYPGLITAARLLGIKLLGVEMDDEGLLPDSLDELCCMNRVSALYCTPTIQNPTNAVMSVERRKAVAQVCRTHNLLILEDDAHGVLALDRPPQLSVFAPERSVLISGLSKAVAAGLRVGYLHAPVALVSRLSTALRTTCWMATPIAFELASHWINQGIAKFLLQQQVAEIIRRKKLVSDLLAGLQFKGHSESPHFWIEVPEPWRASEIEAVLQKKHYLISTADAFRVGSHAVPQFVRASVSNSWGDDTNLYDGFRTLTNTLKQDTNRFETL